MSIEYNGILVRRAQVPEDFRPIPLYIDGPLKCEWVGILMYEDSRECEVVFYDEGGEPREWLFKESLNIGMQEGINITSCKELVWETCHVPGIKDDQNLSWNEVKDL